ncbi:MAG: hypothetical protein PGN16_17115 [Sphingomonas phyllosphaerae]|uniref:hypothetical protein n=1 Tax=Sphingomonas phyllosphaerae TaxID=257003 RepID=UPI002FF6E7C5
MTSVSATRSPPTRAAEPQQRPDQQPRSDDVRAMSDAFARARAKMQPEGTALRPAPAKSGTGKDAPRQNAGTMTGETRERAAALPTDDRHAIHREEERDTGGQSGGQSFAGQLAAPVVGVPTMPAPHVDPSAFAQMLADLWTRENGKGAREVSVRFGRDAWPATGARLVRNAAGTLDISLEVADGAPDYADRLPGLARHLHDAGIGVGALAVAG